MKGFCLGFLAAALASGIAGGAAANEASELKSLVTANDTRGWEAVGRIDLGPDGFCTGALIAPDIVLTAAHCLFDPHDRTRVPVDEIQFLAGWRNGRATAYRGVRHVAIHPGYSYGGPEGAENVGEDVALLKLDQPVRNGSVTPFETASRPRKGDEVGVVSYARNRATRPSLQEVCHVLGRPQNTLVLSCDVDFGSSGAPVFVIEEGEPRIVSVISAKADIGGRPVSLGTSLGEELAELRAALEADAGPGLPRAAARVRPIRTAGQGGAKFLRP